MDSAAFLSALGEVLQRPDGRVSPGFRLEDAVWDSLAIMSTVALIDEHSGATVSGDDLARCATVADVLKLAGFP